MGVIRWYRGQRRLISKLFSSGASGAFAGFGRGSVIELPVRLGGTTRILIGSSVFVGANAWLQVESMEDGPPALVIGDGTSLAGGCILSAAESITVGRKVLFARNVYVADHSHAFEDTGQPVMEQGIDRIAAVHIGDGAWLGENVVVGPGVRIGSGAVVGANSVVLSDVPAYSVAVGAPARVVRAFKATPIASE